jgi:hypothetical protein
MTEQLMTREEKPRLDEETGPVESKRSDLGDVLSLKALGPLLDLELHKLAFVQRLVSIHLNRGEVHEDVVSRLALDKSKSLRCVKPLHHTLFSSQSGNSSASDVLIPVPAHLRWRERSGAQTLDSNHVRTGKASSAGGFWHKRETVSRRRGMRGCLRFETRNFGWGGGEGEKEEGFLRGWKSPRSE